MRVFSHQLTIVFQSPGLFSVFEPICIVISFLVLWSICLSSSLVHFKNGPEYLSLSIFSLCCRVWMFSTFPLISMIYSPFYQSLGDCSEFTNYNWYHRHFYVQHIFSVLWQGVGIYFFFRFLLFSLYGPPRWQSPLFRRFYIFPCEFLTPTLTGGLSLESERQQFSLVSWILLSILANLNNDVDWMVSIRPPISNSSSPIPKYLGTVPRAPITISIIIISCSTTFLVLWQSPSTCISFRFL